MWPQNDVIKHKVYLHQVCDTSDCVNVSFLWPLNSLNQPQQKNILLFLLQMMVQMQSMLSSCGVCKQQPFLYTRPPPTLVGPKNIKPVSNTPKQVLKSLVPNDPCPPGLNSCHPKATCTPNVLASGNYCKVRNCLEEDNIQCYQF